MRIALKVKAPRHWVESRLVNDKHYPAEIVDQGSDMYVVVDQEFNLLQNVSELRSELLKDFAYMHGDREISIVRDDGAIVSLFEFAVGQNTALHKTVLETLLEK